MRTVLIIFGILTLLGVAGGSALLSIRDGKEAKSMEQIEAMGGTGLAGAVLKGMGGGELPSSGSLKTAQMLSYVYLLVALFGMVALFLKNAKIGLIATGLVALFSLLMWIMQPSIDGGSMSGANPKTLAMILMVMGLIGAGCIFGVHKANEKTA